MKRYTLILNLNLFTVILCCISIVEPGCNKKSTPPQYDFSYTGTLKAYDTVWFSTNNSAKSSLRWNFGDGNYSDLFEYTSYHVYSDINTYKVSLTIDGDTLHSAVHILNITRPALTEYTSHIPKMRNWHHYRTMYNPGLMKTDTLNDTTFTIHMLSDIKICIGSDTLEYTKYTKYTKWPTKTDSILFFTKEEKYLNTVLYSYNLYYYINSDSVRYSEGGHHKGSEHYFTY